MILYGGRSMAATVAPPSPSWKAQKRGISLRTDYVWEEMYKAAIVETDNGMLPNRIQAAKAAIDSRLHALQGDHGGTPEERVAISDALAGLIILLIILRRELESRTSEKRSSKS
jgi:hypothetical protein